MHYLTVQQNVMVHTMQYLYVKQNLFVAAHKVVYFTPQPNAMTRSQDSLCAEQHLEAHSAVNISA